MIKVKFQNLSLKKKILIPIITVAVLTGLLTYFYFVNLYENTLISEHVDQARTLILAAESVREYVADQQKSKIFNKDLSNLEDVLKTVPIFAAMQTARAKAKELNFGFKVPKFSPRNPDNQPDDYEAKILKSFETGNQQEYFAIDNETNKIRYFKPVRLTQECLKCHGDPNKSQEYWNRTDGKDITGTKMEGWKVGEVHGAFEVMVDMAPIQAAVSQKSFFIAGISLSSVLLTVFISLFISKNITRPISLIKDRIALLENNCVKNLNNGLEALAHGDFSINVGKVTQPINLSQSDEVGEIATSFDSMVRKTQGAVDSYNTVRQKISDVTKELQSIITEAKEGNLNHRGNDEVFEGTYKNLVKSTNNLLDAVTSPIKVGIDALEVMSQGDFTIRIQSKLNGDFNGLKDSINKLGDSVCIALTEVKKAAEATASASAQISSSTEEMAAGAQEQSSQTTEIAGSIEQMSKTILETTNNANTAAVTAKQAGETALLGSGVIHDTVEGMRKIAEVVKIAAKTVQELGASSEQIGTIVQVIDEIADQTNLLALNAAIEAARAGEQGRGFAVVADEVRKLAERTTKATKEIGEMIKKIQNDTSEAVRSMQEGTNEVENGLQLAEKSGESLGKIVESVTKVNNIIAQVADASEEQSSTAEQISKSIEGINTVTQQSATGVQQIARAAEDLNNLTLNLQNMVEQFRIDENTQYNSNKNNLIAKSHMSVRSNGALVKSGFTNEPA